MSIASLVPPSLGRDDAREPGGTAMLTAAWRHLLFVNYEARPEHLVPHLPPGTELDLRDGRAYVSLVGLRFIRTKVLGVAVPFLGAFDRVDLRFPVIRTTPAGDVRQGVVFLRELVPHSVLAFAARLAVNEPYESAGLRSTVPYGGFDAVGRVEYSWEIDGRWHAMEATTKGKPAVPPEDSETAWLAHRLWSYTRQSDNSTMEFAVDHPRWRTWDVPGATVTVDAGAALLAPALNGRPVSAFVAEGSAIRAFSPVGFRHSRR